MENKKKLEFPLKLSTSNRKMLPIVKQKLREKVPPISPNKLRRLKMKFHEALLLELKESQHLNAYNFFNEIILKDSEDSNILTSNNELAEMIFNELKKAEDSTKDEEIEILLKLGRTIDDLETPIRWLVGKIYSRALMTIKNFMFGETRVDAFAKYFYGKFLAEEKNYEDAVTTLEDSLKICFEVEEWIVEGTSLDDSKELNILVADELFKSLMDLSKEVKSKDPEYSLELTKKSLKIVRNYGIDDNLKKEIDCEMEFANCFEKLKEFDKAQRKYELVFEMTIMCGLHQVGLDALVKMSECYKSLKNFDKFEETLNRAKEHAKSDPTSSVAEGDILVTLGKLSIEQNDKKKALECFNQAVQVFEKADDKKKLQNVRMLMALPLGEFGEKNLTFMF